jgi:hypothetical protein
MRNQIDLPAEFLSGPFTLTEAKARGVHPGDLRRADVEGVSRGLYRPAGWDFELESAARALSAATPGAWISHVTAARLRCSCLPPWLSESTELHLSKPRPLPAVRRKGIIGHKVIVAEDEVESVDGIRISTRSRTWLDMAKLLPLNDLVCMGDELIRVPRMALEGRDAPFATLSGLRAMVERHPNLQGIVRAREALELMRVGSDSAPESLLRLAMLDAGIPEPELQVTLRRDIRSRRRRTWASAKGGLPYSTTATITSPRPSPSATGGGIGPSKRQVGPCLFSARRTWPMVSS